MSDIEYDAESKVVYVYLEPNHEAPIAYTTEIIPDRVLIDFDADGVAVGIEILDVSNSD